MGARRGINQAPAIMPRDENAAVLLDAEVRDWFAALTPAERMRVYVTMAP